MSTGGTSGRRPPSTPRVSSPPGASADPGRGAVQPEVVSIYDGAMGESCRRSHPTSGNQGEASSVAEPVVTSGASSPGVVPAEPEVEYHRAGSRSTKRYGLNRNSCSLAAQQPPATVACFSERVPISLRSEMSCSAGTRTIVGDVIDYSALPGSSSLQRASATISILIIAPANSRFMRSPFQQPSRELWPLWSLSCV